MFLPTQVSFPFTLPMDRYLQRPAPAPATPPAARLPPRQRSQPKPGIRDLPLHLRCESMLYQVFKVHAK